MTFYGSGLEARVETVDQQQQDQQRLSHGEPQETLDETQVSYCSYDKYFVEEMRSAFITFLFTRVTL